MRSRICVFRTRLSMLVLLILISANVSSAEEVSVHSFINRPYGAFPEANVIFDSAGNLYGTTADGGAFNGGTVFEITPTATGEWREKILHNFSGADGCSPASNLVFDSAGNLYGTTTYGGSGATNCLYEEYGAVFKLSPSDNGNWTETVLHSFAAGSDGSEPASGVVFDAAGNLYGVTRTGGSGGLGIVYQLIPSPAGPWTEKILYGFTGQSDGGEPTGLIIDEAGNLYGGTIYGGDLNCPVNYDRYAGCGVVFELAYSGSGSWSETELHV